MSSTTTPSPEAPNTQKLVAPSNMKLVTASGVLIIVGLLAMSTFQYYMIGFSTNRSLNTKYEHPMFLIGAVGMLVGLPLFLRGLAFYSKYYNQEFDRGRLVKERTVLNKKLAIAFIGIGVGIVSGLYATHIIPDSITTGCMADARAAAEAVGSDGPADYTFTSCMKSHGQITIGDLIGRPA